MKKILLSIVLGVLIFPLAAQNSKLRSFSGIGNLVYFERAYPDLTFTRHYEIKSAEWTVTVKVPDSAGDKDGPGKTYKFYWANGSMLPAEELANKKQYSSLLYEYAKELKDPQDFTEEERERIKEYGSKESRKNGAGTPMFFFDAVYDSTTRGSLEKHITKTTFLGKRTNIHERIKEPLSRVEAKIVELGKTDSEVKAFIDSLKSSDGYLWRIIDGTNRKSFHSLGIAIDILPKIQRGKQIFWSWAKDIYPETWMLVPLKDRWIPPKSVISAFEEEGFIWGGKWTIYDNMHFEYHPELIQYNFYK